MKRIAGILLAAVLLAVMLSAMSFSVYAIQKPTVQMLTFTVSGAETYADGSALAEDECYALVWSGDGEFDGINPNGTPTGEWDEVVYIGTIYKDDNVFFQLPAGSKSGGIFEIFILDTRVFDDNGKLKSVGKTKGIVNVRDYVKAANAEVGVYGIQPLPTVDSTSNGGIIATPSADTEEIPAFRFTSIKVDGDWVVMLATDAVTGVNYATVADGKEPGTTTPTDRTTVLIRPKTGDSAIIRGMVKTVFSTGDLRIIITIAAVFTVSVLLLAFSRKKRASERGKK